MASIICSCRNKGNLALLLMAFLLILIGDNTTAEWINHGGNLLTNRRNAVGENRINKQSLKDMKLKWRFITGSDVSATPAVADGVVYFPSWNGNLYAVDADNGKLIWKQSIGQLTGLPGTGLVVNVSVSRSTPTIAGPLLMIGIYQPAVVIAVKRSTGGLVWKTMLDPHPLAVITCSGTVFLWEYVVGVSSQEERLPPSQCCTFRGSLVKLHVLTGAILWQTYTLPDNGGQRGGYSGAAVWGSSPAIDLKRQLVYVGTGNLYTAPQSVYDCQEARNNQTSPTGLDQCIGPDVHFDSILAFSLRSGQIVWSRQLGGYDVYVLACFVPNNPDCPTGPNPDADFGEAPMLLTVSVKGKLRDIAVAAQKSGFVWALDRDNGDIVWFKRAGPGSVVGGGIWGAATDGTRVVYTNIGNGDRVLFTLEPSNQTTTAGAWVALDASNGSILWSTANPSNDSSVGPVTLVNGLLFAGSVAPEGPLYAMDARTGTILWSTNVGATVYGGASASYGCIFIGDGYKVFANFFPTYTGGDSVSAYCVDA